MFWNRVITYCADKECKLTNCMRNMANAPIDESISIREFDCPAFTLEEIKKLVEGRADNETD